MLILRAKCWLMALAMVFLSWVQDLAENARVSISISLVRRRRQLLDLEEIHAKRG